MDAEGRCPRSYWRCGGSQASSLWEDCGAQMGEGVEVQPDSDLAAQPAPEITLLEGIHWRLTCQTGRCCGRSAGISAVRGLCWGAIIDHMGLNFLSIEGKGTRFVETRKRYAAALREVGLS